MANPLLVENEGSKRKKKKERKEEKKWPVSLANIAHTLLGPTAATTTTVTITKTAGVTIRASVVTIKYN